MPTASCHSGEQLWLRDSERVHAPPRCLLKQLLCILLTVIPSQTIYDNMRTRLGALTGLLLLTLSLSGVAAKKSQPEISETGFKSIPQNLFYFDDSDVVIVTDVLPGVVYRSTNAGSDWTPIKDITEGQVLEVLWHPWDNKVAVAVGIEKTHWITKDQGKTWKAFKTAHPPVLGRLPISFHAADPERMIILVADCLGFDCTMKVRSTTPSWFWDRANPNRHTTPLTGSIHLTSSTTTSSPAFGQRAPICSPPATPHLTRARFFALLRANTRCGRRTSVS